MANSNRDDSPDSSSPTECAKYANYFKVSFNPFELIMDFGQFYLEATQPSIHTRIVTTPSFGKAFLELLEESIREFEETSGPLADPSNKMEGSE
jgi:hypothetical protein